MQSGTLIVGNLNSVQEQIEHIKKIRKKRRISSSRLNKYLHEILELSLLHDASYADIALWLRTYKRTKVSRQAVGTFINRHLATLDGIEISPSNENKADTNG